MLRRHPAPEAQVGARRAAEALFGSRDIGTRSPLAQSGVRRSDGALQMELALSLRKEREGVRGRQEKAKRMKRAALALGSSALGAIAAIAGGSIVLAPIMAGAILVPAILASDYLQSMPLLVSEDKRSKKAMELLSDPRASSRALRRELMMFLSHDVRELRSELKELRSELRITDPGIETLMMEYIELSGEDGSGSERIARRDRLAGQIVGFFSQGD